MSFKFTDHQEQLRDIIRKFLSDIPIQGEFNLDGSARIERDKIFWSKVAELGMFDLFAPPDGASTLHDLGLIAFEAGRALSMQTLAESLLVGPFLARLLPEEILTAIVASLGCSRDDFLRGAIRGTTALQPGAISQFIDSQKGDRTGPLKHNIAPGNITPIKKASRNNSNGEVYTYRPSDSKFILILDPADGSSAQAAFLSLSDAETPTIAAALDITRPLSTISLHPGRMRILDSAVAVFLTRAWSALKACELAGMAERCVAMTVEYVSTRKQFGVPVGAFQAMQHQLADAHLKAEATKSLSTFAVWSCDHSKDQFSLAAFSALLYARQSVPEVIETAIQLHGGIGFTWEHALHLYLRRAKSIEIQSEFMTDHSSVDAILSCI